FRAIGGAILVAAAPCLAPRMRVEAFDAFPRRAGIARAKQSLRRRAGVPDARLVRMSGREPERVIDDASALRRERRRLHRFLPRAAVVHRAEYRGTEVARARCGEQRASIARIG